MQERSLVFPKNCLALLGVEVKPLFKHSSLESWQHFQCNICGSINKAALDK